jgi:hypothetical protein
MPFDISAAWLNQSFVRGPLNSPAESSVYAIGCMSAAHRRGISRRN